jgi:CheY-like chemotaxis protein
MPPDPLLGRRILVVEDNEVVCERLALVLGNAGFVVVTASNGGEALAMLGGGLRPSLILLDMLTPGLDGWGFFAARRLDPALATVPVVIHTALGVASPEWAVSLGATGLLRKPVEAEELLAEIRRCLAQRGDVPG